MANASPGNASQSSPRSRQRSDNKKNFTSLTIAQVRQAQKENDAESGEFWLDGRQLLSVIIVGVVREQKTDSSKDTYVVDDGTGFIEVQWWNNNNSDSEAQTRAELQVNKTVRVFGRVSVHNNVRRIQAFRILLVEDSNVVTFHLLECISHFLHTQKKSVSSVSGAGSLGAGTTMPAGSVYGQQASNVAGDNSVDSKHQPVLAAIASFKTDEGACVDEVIDRLAGVMDAQQVRKSIEWLNEDGHIYSTIDDNYYRVVDEDM